MTDLYELREPLEMLFDMINRDSEAIENDRNPLLEARTKRILGNVWWDFKAEGARRKDDVRAIRGIVNGVYNLQVRLGERSIILTHLKSLIQLGISGSSGSSASSRILFLLMHLVDRRRTSLALELDEQVRTLS